MQVNHFHDYVSPTTGNPLQLSRIDQTNDNDVVEGTLSDEATGDRFPIHRSIPRFVGQGNYADSFGLQWNRYRRVQLDSVNGSRLSWDRFFEGTGWDPDKLRGARVLEAGCGAGRFSEVLLKCGARLCSFDYSSAVDAAWLNLGGAPGWSLCQADIFSLPYPEGSFDYVFCFGVLQHTPDPRRAFQSLVRAVKPGGQLAVDVYQRQSGLNKLAVKYWYRPITRRLPHGVLLRLCEAYLPLWVPVDRLLGRIPLIGPALSSLVPCWNKWSLPLSRQHRMEWTILDTFDAFSPEFDQPQSEPEVRDWFDDAGLVDVSVHPGGNGIEGSGRRAA
ncbi:hypothetical protein AYO44_10670 [Planctomycetaceae bacterium SCGC AG-212-F19]|nr:hypothetical protein AYO44_10670 [Planctomycetaceae bacterium SCGC AG-212-F19]